MLKCLTGVGCLWKMSSHCQQTVHCRMLLPESATLYKYMVFHDPLVPLNFDGFDPQIFLIDPQNLMFTTFNLYEGGHCDPLNRKLRENTVNTSTFSYISIFF